MQPPIGIDASCQLGLQADNLGFEKIKGFLNSWVVFSGNTHEKCAGVHKGIPIIYFGNYMYQQYAIWCCYIMVYVATNVYEI